VARVRAGVIPVNDGFWVATAEGRFASVTVTRLGASQRRQIAAAPSS
jgi:hypothetical protein